MHLIALQPPPMKEKEKPLPKDDTKPAIATKTNKKTNQNNDFYFYTKNINDKFNAFTMTRVNVKNGKRFSVFEFLVFPIPCKKMA